MFTNTLPNHAQKSLAILGRAKVLPPKTYLAGGSALALHFGHRISVDFDFFTPESFNQEILAKNLSAFGKFEVTDVSPDTLLGVFENTKFSIFRYQYPLILPEVNCKGISVCSKEDIGAMKIQAVMTRGTKKDFIDLYFLDKNKIGLEANLVNYDKKYGALAANVYSIITSLSYFTEAEESQMPKMLIKTSWKDVRTFFLREAIALGKKYLR